MAYPRCRRLKIIKSGLMLACAMSQQLCRKKANWMPSTDAKRDTETLRASISEASQCRARSLRGTGAISLSQRTAFRSRISSNFNRTLLPFLKLKTTALSKEILLTVAASNCLQLSEVSRQATWHLLTKRFIGNTPPLR